MQMFKRLMLASVFVAAIWAMMLPVDTLSEVLNRAVVDRLATVHLQTLNWFNPSNDEFSNDRF
jgi:hypothetical protein